MEFTCQSSKGLFIHHHVVFDICCGPSWSWSTLWARPGDPPLNWKRKERKAYYTNFYHTSVGAMGTALDLMTCRMCFGVRCHAIEFCLIIAHSIRSSITKSLFLCCDVTGSFPTVYTLTQCETFGGCFYSTSLFVKVHRDCNFTSKMENRHRH